MKKYLILVISLIIVSNNYSQNKSFKIRTIAFYNVENLFDTINDPNKNDEASPIMEFKGNKSKVYWQKIDNMAKVISEIGFKDAKTAPAVIGISEVENRAVIEDLVASKYLKKYNYGIVHYDSPDERSIDVALLYQKQIFKPISHKSYELKLFRKSGERDYTRDQLLVTGYLDDEPIHLIVNHWPSRSGGEARSRSKREAGAALNVKIIKEVQEKYPNAKVITMGDFNDDPTNSSFKKVLKTKGKKAEVKDGDIYNPMENMYRRGLNTLGYRDNINLFDQILITSPLLANTKEYKDYKMFKANIFNPKYLINKKGKYKGYPFRSWGFQGFTGGYSDHYPVYIYLIKEN